MPNLRKNPLTISPTTSPSDVPSTSLSDGPSDVPSSSPSDDPSTNPLDVPSTGPSDVPSTGPSDAEPSTCTSLSASAVSSTSNKSGKKIPSSGRSNLPTEPTPSPLAVALRPSLAAPCSPQSECTTPSFVYFRNDGEHIDSDGPTTPPWTQFEVTLKDENGNHRLDSKGDPITVIAPPPSELQGRVFLTKPDERGDIKCARVVEIMKWADANDLEHKQILEYKAFIDNGQFIESNIPNGYRQIRTFDANLMHDVLSGKAVTGILHFYAQLHKRHNVLSFHYVWSLMACGLINLQHIKSEANVSDILSKHCGYQACWELIRPIFHFRGDTGKFTTISDLRNFHDGECYHNVKVFPQWFKPYHDFRCKEFPRWGVLPRCGSTDDFYDMTGDVTNNHTRITTPIDLISSTDITILSPLSVINALDYWGVIKCKIHRVSIRAMNHILIPSYLRSL
jgi:hypothetical protein